MQGQHDNSSQQQRNITQHNTRQKNIWDGVFWILNFDPWEKKELGSLSYDISYYIIQHYII